MVEILGMKPETVFRIRVGKFLKSLTQASIHPIQQKAIRGDADFIICLNGNFVWLELKTDVGEMAPLQEYKFHKVKRCGGVTIEAQPANWEEVKLFLMRLNQRDEKWERLLHLRLESCFSTTTSGKK